MLNSHNFYLIFFSLCRSNGCCCCNLLFSSFFLIYYDYCRYYCAFMLRLRGCEERKGIDYLAEHLRFKFVSNYRLCRYCVSIGLLLFGLAEMYVTCGVFTHWRTIFSFITFSQSEVLYHDSLSHVNAVHMGLFCSILCRWRCTGSIRVHYYAVLRRQIAIEAKSIVGGKK